MKFHTAFIISLGSILSINANALTISSTYGDVDGINANASSFFTSRLIAPELDRTLYYGANNSITNVASSSNEDGTDQIRIGEFSFNQSFNLDPAATIESAFLEISAGGHALIGLMSSVYVDGGFVGNFSTGTENTANVLHNNPDSVNYSNLLEITNLSALADRNINIRLVPGRSYTTWTLDYARVIINYSFPEDKVDDSTDSSGGGTGGGTVAPVPVPAAFWLFASGIVFLMRKRAVNK